MRYDGIIFDFDGTLADTSQGVLSSVEYALDKMGRRGFDRRALRGFIGPALYVSFQKITGLSAAEAEQAIVFYRENYIPKGVYECRLFPGVEELLSGLCLKGARLAVASSKPQPSLDVVTEYLGIAKYFTRIVGADPSVKSNDKAGLLSRALVGRDNIMVGDTVYDIDAAKEVGVASVAVTYGFMDKEQLLASRPDYIADSAAQLSSLLMK